MTAKKTHQLPAFPAELRANGFIPLWEQLAIREKTHQLDNIDKALLLADVKRGLDAREFLYFYQPQWNLQTGNIEALDSSLRWHHPQKGLLGADYFMPIFEETHLMPQLTTLLFEQILNDRAQLVLNGFSNLKIIIKLTPHQLKLKNLADELLDMLFQKGIDMSAIECALSDRKFPQYPHSVRQNLQTFHSAGISLSIDNFGTGFSAYPYLLEFPFSKIKLEKNYATDITKNPRGQLIIQSVINLAHLLNADIVIDGIDSLSVIRWLRMTGCDMGQGCFFGGSMILEDLVDFLEEYRKIATKGKTAIENFWVSHAKQVAQFSPDCQPK